jgi:hypothetical protein
MSRLSALLTAIIAVLIAVHSTPASLAMTDEPPKTVHHPVDTPFFTLQGPDAPMIALIQTVEEVEYIGDYLDLDLKRARSALRLLRHVDFEESMLLVVNGGPVEGAMLRIDTVYEQSGELYVWVTSEEPPQQYRDSAFMSPASETFTPSVVAVIPRFQGRLVVVAYEADWAASGDLRGVELVVQSPSALPESSPGDDAAGTGGDENQ